MEDKPSGEDKYSARGSGAIAFEIATMMDRPWLD
jgi:hypothetical protein